MPVRSLHSSVLKWPNREKVHEALQDWAAAVGRENEHVARVGYFGSYARGDWGVGSDLDVVILVSRTDRLFERRAMDFDVTGLPVPADVLVYTKAEWAKMQPEESRHAANMQRETVWVWTRGQKD